MVSPPRVKILASTSMPNLERLPISSAYGNIKLLTSSKIHQEPHKNLVVPKYSPRCQSANAGNMAHISPIPPMVYSSGAPHKVLVSARMTSDRREGQVRLTPSLEMIAMRDP